ncbi:MAG: PIG-L deacetylase family protein [Bacteroidota bacterium]
MQVLILLAHADDETLGAGGTIQQLIQQGHQVQLLIASEGLVKLREEAADNRASLAKACELLGLSEWDTLGLPDQQFEGVPVADICRLLPSRLTFEPDLIISHSQKDLNRDHRIIAEVAHIVGRPRAKPVSLLACEIPSVSIWHGYPFHPTFYVGLTSAQLDKKLEAFAAYKHEIRPFPDPYSLEGLRILAQNRGMESGLEAAEAFELIRWYPQHGWGQ